jgi:hypothetical protein
MNVEELKLKLDELGISEQQYSLFGNNLPETTVLDHQSKWSVYKIYERGLKGRVFSFETENDACEYFLEIMRKEKEREERIKNMPPYVPPPPPPKRTFIVSETGEANVRKEER